MWAQVLSLLICSQETTFQKSFFAAVTWEDLQGTEFNEQKVAVHCTIPLVCFPRIPGDESVKFIELSLSRVLTWLFLFVLIIQKMWRSPGKEGSHFLPSSSLFDPKDEQDVVVSTMCWSAMVALLVGLSWLYGPLPMLKLYGLPYMVGAFTDFKKLSTEIA